MSAIPVIDVGPCFSGVRGALADTAATLRDTLERVGFFVMVNHSVPQPLIDATFAEAQRFHDQPMGVKIALKMNEHNNGYMALGRYAVRTSDVNANDKPDLNEAFFCKRELAPEHPLRRSGRRFVGPNLWPAGLPGFREQVLAPAPVHHRDRRARHPLHPRAFEAQGRAARHRHARVARLDPRADQARRPAHRPHGLRRPRGGRLRRRDPVDPRLWVLRQADGDRLGSCPHRVR